MLRGAAACAQGAAVAFTSLCEAVVSWQHIRHEGLRTKITRIMQMYKAKLVRCVSRGLSHIVAWTMSFSSRWTAVLWTA